MRLQKFYLEFDDPTKSGLMQYQMENLEGYGLSNIRLPFNVETFSTNYIRLEFYETATGKPVVVDSPERLRYLVLGAEVETPELRHWKQKDRFLNSLLPADFKQSHEKFPAIKISDVTERDMFGYEEIPESKLGDKGGIWAWHGLRKIEISVEGVKFDVDNIPAGSEQRAALYFFKMEDKDLQELIIAKDIRFNRRNKTYIAYLNTNLFGEEIKNIRHSSPTFKGHFELHLYSAASKVVYSFPVDICVHDTRLDDELKNHLLDGHGVVSIDFGTSSTCAAVMGTGMPELITLSGKISKGNNRYENPTNLMIYDWNEFYRQWEHSNPNCPFLICKKNNMGNIEADYDYDYDSGYTVNDVLKTITTDNRGRRRAKAVVTDLKIIPGMSREKRSQIRIYPLNDITQKVIKVTDDFTQEDDSTLDPIAFYGYLLSRVINNPVRQKIYRYYNITFPVKFSSEVREKICSSLAYGIRRALPQPMVEAQDNQGKPFIAVNMYYEEAVACAGAVVANQLVINDESPRAKPFAIFDLGGGTLDTAYGIFRPSRGEEYTDYTIQIFGCGGNEFVGGEKLIHQIAYKIYLDNRAETEAKKIPFVLPQGEHYPEGFEGLLTEIGDEIANANVGTLKENIARPLFQHAELVKGKMNDVFKESGMADGADTCKIKLRNQNNEEVDLTLAVEGIDDFLKAKIEAAVLAFKADMDTLCQSDKILEALEAAGIYGYNPKDFAIFLGGNASKQHYVAELMEKNFPEGTRIERIARANSDVEKDLSNRYKLNGKTAVAFGQLKLDDYYIDKSTYQTNEGEERAPFPFYVGYKDPGSGKFACVLKKNDNSREWQKANTVNPRVNRMNLFFTAGAKEDMTRLRPCNEKVEGVEHQKQQLWIRVAPDAHNSIEYRIGGKNEKFSADEPMDPNRVVKL